MPEAPVLDIAFRSVPVTYEPPPFIGMGGGEAVFLGRTRRETHPDHGPLLALEYEAYESMALKQLDAMARETAHRHEALFVRIRHSLGRVPVGAASVLIQVVCGHRGEAFVACRALIDRLKTEAPIWKREVWERGEATWPEGHSVEAGIHCNEREAAPEANLSPGAAAMTEAQGP